MTYIFFPTVVVAALGLFAAKAGDLLRTPLFEPRPCADNASVVVWAYEAAPEQRRGAGRAMRPGARIPVLRSGTC
ncbi:MAG: hypothetical protein WB561_11190 [Terracidiphilus sp.]